MVDLGQLYFDGDAGGIAWAFRQAGADADEYRAHPEMYAGRIGAQDSRYVAYHAGLFWCIGTFRIKSGDAVEVMVSSQAMHDHLAGRGPAPSQIADQKAGFAGQLVSQRSLAASYCLIRPDQNIASAGLGSITR